MNTKRKIEDYENKLVAIFCSSIEEWDKINDLLGKKGLTRDYGDISDPDNAFVDCIHINGRGTASKKHYEQASYTIYSASDFLQEEPEFEGGKWYKRNEISNSKGYLMYVKPLEINIKDNKQIYKERINGDGEYINLKKTSSCTFKNFTLLTNLEEIQEFLPEGHADKIKTEIIPEYVEYIDTKYKGKIVKVEDWCCGSYCKVIFYNGIKEQPFKHLVKPSTRAEYEAQNKPKQLNVKDLIKGEIYVFDINSIKNFISKFDYSDSYNYYDTCFIQGNEFDNEPESATIGDINNIRLANNEEKKWLTTCISQDKFIPKENLHLYDDSGLLIKKEEAMFKKNDYIVVLYNDNSLNSWTNQCFKQLEDLYYLKVVKNLNGNTDGWSVINFKNQSKWRYASSAEILEYERIGKPFDVTTLIKKEKSLVKQVQEGLKLKDRWVKCVKECGWNTINVGEYIQILENNSLVPYVEWKDNKEKYCIDLDRIDKAEFELMPEGFSPNEKEWIHNQYPLTPIESFQPSIYDLKDIHIPSITKKTKKLQTITIESTTDLNLNLTKIKSKQIQTIKI